MSKVVIAGDASGTGTFTISAPNGNTDRTLVLPDEAGTVLTSAGVPASAMPAGSVIQVVNYIDTGETTTTGDWTDTGLTVSITPTSSSSKILIIAHQTGLSSNIGNAGLKLRLMRNSTVLTQFENGAAYQSGDNDVGGSGITYLDSPSTTTPTTYKTQFGRGAGNSGTVKVGHYGVSSGITVMEIAA